MLLRPALAPLSRRRLLRLLGAGALAGGLVACAAAAPTGPGRGIILTDGERLWLLDPAAQPGRGDARRELLSSRGRGTLSDPAWSPDRLQIAYAFTPPVAAGGGFGSDIYLVSAGGRDARLLFAHDADGGLARTPAWSADGAAVYFAYSFTSPQTGRMEQRIERIETASSARSVIASDADLPSLSPDGRRLAFVRYPVDFAGPPSLWLADVDGGNARQLVAADGYQAIWAPRFSPDGRTLLFSAAGDRSRPRLTLSLPDKSVGGGWVPSVLAHGFPMDIWTIAVDGGRPELLAAIGADDLYTIWAPDGRRLAFLSAEGLFLVDLTSGELTSLSSAPAYGAIDWAPAASP